MRTRDLTIVVGGLLLIGTLSFIYLTHTGYMTMPGRSQVFGALLSTL